MRTHGVGRPPPVKRQVPAPARGIIGPPGSALKARRCWVSYWCGQWGSGVDNLTCGPAWGRRSRWCARRMPGSIWKRFRPMPRSSIPRSGSGADVTRRCGQATRASRVSSSQSRRACMDCGRLVARLGVQAGIQEDARAGPRPLDLNTLGRATQTPVAHTAQRPRRQARPTGR